MDISDLMTKDEYIVKELELKGRLSLRPETKVCATNKRLIIDRGEDIIEIGYQHIASMTIKGKYGIPFIIVGVIIVLVGAVGMLNIIEFALDLLPEAVSGAFIVLGLILVVFGLIKNKELSITLPGIKNYEMLSGARVDLEKLFAIVRDSQIEEKE